MKLLWIALLLPTLIYGVEYCEQAELCIKRLQQIVTEQRQFWFGEQWKLLCSDKGHHRHHVDCYDPNELKHFYSIGNRLFRVKTYQAGYLKNLRIFPRIIFKPKSGNYRACDHSFSVNESLDATIETGFDRPPVEPFRLRSTPEIKWPGYNNGASYIVLFIDIGFGTLNYLAYGFPLYTKVIQPYKPSENFRASVNPVAVLIFDLPKRLKYNDVKLQPDSQLFDLPKFMLENGLENGLIGMNLILVSYDAYAIEKQRLKGVADNCQFLIEQKLQNEQPWEFIKTFPLSEMDSWLSVEYHQPEISAYVCCKNLNDRRSPVHLDPIANVVTPSLAVRQPPDISSLRIFENDIAYQRNTRDFIGISTIEHLHTLILFEPEQSILHWMVIDIPSSSLASGHIQNGDTVAPYLLPIPNTPRKCSPYVFMLFVQPRSTTLSPMAIYHNANHTLRSLSCQQNCNKRKFFDVREFKSFHQLRLSAINWMTVCYDLHEARRQITKISSSLKLQESKNTKNPEAIYSSIESKNTSSPSFRKRFIGVKEEQRVIDPEKEICAAMGIPRDEVCKGSAIRVKFSSLISLLVLWLSANLYK